MAEPSRVKVRRHRLHVRGDHSECLPRNCPLAGTVEAGDDVAGLRRAVEAEFAGDPRLPLGLRLAELAAGQGPAAVSAIAQLDRMTAAGRSGAGSDSRQVRHELVARIAEKVTAIAERRARRRLIEEAGGKDPAAMAAMRERAMRELRDAIEAEFLRGRSAPAYLGPITVDEEIKALVARLARCECPCHAAGHDREEAGGGTPVG